MKAVNLHGEGAGIASPAFSDTPQNPPGSLPGEALRRLFAARLLLVGGEMLAVLAVASLTTIRLPAAPLLALLLLHGLLLAAFAAAALADRHAGLPGRGLVFLHLLADAGVIAAMVYLSGGYANPFISLLLLPLILCATLLPSAWTWAMTALVALLYTLLMVYYRPLQTELTDVGAVNLHLWGMWLNFLFTAGLVAIFVARLSAGLHARDRALAAAREAALRDEQLFALGMQAAAAAHDLATPLATLGLTLEGLAEAYSNDEELAPPLAAMTAQAARMKTLLGRLRDFAAAARAADRPLRPLDEWLAELLEHWQLMRPQATVTLHPLGTPPAPVIRDEPMVAAAVTTMLNNAADVSPREVQVECRWSAGEWRVAVLDRGPGPAGAGVKPEGWGVGVQLAQAALERLGGGLAISPRPGGGSAASLRLPLHSPVEVGRV